MFSLPSEKIEGEGEKKNSEVQLLAIHQHP
jgi:hypothetical protein